ncbi:MAG: hypothetical protein MJZ57_05905, partial [Bacteroidales bacterium]|nr:hypothetical protein [Bacteroidales bacterium]
YHRGHYLISSGEQLFKLENEDLKSLLSPFDYDKYLHAQKNIRTAIPLFVISGCSLPIVGLGLAEFFSGWITMSKYNIAILANEETGLILTKNFTKGFFIAAAGLIIADAFLIPALALTIKSVNNHHRICSNFNENINFKKHQAMKLSLGGTPWGTSLTLTF